MPSPLFYINGGSVGAKAAVSAASTVTCTLNDLTGVRQVEWSIIGTDETSSPASYTLGTSGPLGSVMTTTALTAGTAALVKCRINGGIDTQTEQPSDDTVATAKFFVRTGQSLEVLCAGEEFESSSTAGTHLPINESIRAVDSTAAASANAISWKTSVRACATTNITLSGGTTVIDGVTMATGDRLLAAGQTTASENGIYVWASGIWARATDSDSSGEWMGGLTVYVQEGTVNGKKLFVCTNTGVINLNSTNLTFQRLAGFDGSANVVIGDDSVSNGVQLRAKTGGGIKAYINGSEIWTADANASITAPSVGYLKGPAAQVEATGSILVLQSNSETYFNSGSQIWYWRQGATLRGEKRFTQVQTTNATVTTIDTVAISDNTTVKIRAHVTGDQSGSANSAGYEIVATVKRAGGVATLVGAVAQLSVQEDAAGWDATIDVDGGNNARVRVTGGVTDTIDWKCHTEIEW